MKNNSELNKDKEVLIMGTDDMRIRDLLGKQDVVFVVPPFQRNYDWKSKTCKALIDDLKENINNDYAYYLHEIVYVMHRSELDDYSVYSIIDGQQRITTLLLILNAIKVLKGGKYNKAIDDLYLFNHIIDKTEDYSKYKIKQTSDDYKNFSGIIDGNLKEVDKESNIYIQYNFIYNYLKEKCYDCLDKLYNEICTARYTKVSIKDKVDDKDIQRIYEKINSSGQELKASDLIRNNLLIPFDYKKQESIYSKYWKEIEKDTHDEIEKFFRYYLISKTGKEIKDERVAIYEAFKEYYSIEIKKENMDIEEIVKDIYRYSKFYEVIRNANHENKNIRDALLRINKLDIKAVYPLYLKLLDLNYKSREEYTDDVILEMLLSIENYIVRRQLTIDYETKNYNKLFGNFYNRIINKYDELTIETLKYGLLELEQTNKYPTDEEVKRGISEKNIYKRSKDNPLSQLVLERINAYSNIKEAPSTQELFEKFDLYTKKGEDGYSIEHIMPKGKSDNEIQNLEWKAYLGTDANVIFQKWVNKLANLTLTGYNSELGDKNFEDKRKIYIQSGLAINTTYFGNVNSWKEEDLVKRNDYLTKLIIEKIYKHLVSNYKPVVKTITLEDIDNDSVDFTVFSAAQKEKIKYSVKYNNEYIIKNENIKSFVELYKKVMGCIYKDYKIVINEIVSQKDNVIITAKEKPYSSSKPYKLDENVYLETHGGIADLLNYMISIFEKCDANKDSLVFEFVKKDYDKLLGKV